jgi:hypothetical protein
MAAAVADEGLNTAAALRPQKDARVELAVTENELKTVILPGVKTLGKLVNCLSISIPPFPGGAT